MATIQEGALTFEALRKKIGVGTGNCKAKRCRPNIEKRIKDYKESLAANSESGNPPCYNKFRLDDVRLATLIVTCLL